MRSHNETRVVARLMVMGTPGPLLSLRLNPARETAADLFLVPAVARYEPTLVQTFSTDRDSEPEWVTLLALLQEFIEIRDGNMGGRRLSAQRIYNRDGWGGRA